MYSLTFCIRFLLLERRQWKPAVHTVAVIEKTLVGGEPVAPRFPYAARGFRDAVRHPSVTGRRRAQTSPNRPFALCRDYGGMVASL